MKIKINGETPKQKLILKPEAILRYLITDDDKIGTLIMCKSSEVDLITDDYAIYEALGSVKPFDNFKLNKLRKLFEVATISSYKQRIGEEKPILKQERVEELRKLALKNK